MQKKLIISVIFVIFLVSLIFAGDDIKRVTVFIVKDKIKTEKKTDAIISDGKIYINKEGVKEIFNYDLKKVSSDIAIACTDTSCFPFYFNDAKKPLLEKGDAVYINIGELASHLKLEIADLNIEKLSVNVIKTSVETKQKTLTDDDITSKAKSKK